jgi:hypothetical protein
MDPRVRATPADLEHQYALAVRLVEALRRDSLAIGQVRSLRSRLRTFAGGKAVAPQSAAIDSLEQDARRLETGEGEPPPPPGGRARENLTRLNGELARLYSLVEGADPGPTRAMLTAAGSLEHALEELLSRQRTLEERERSVAQAPR